MAVAYPDGLWFWILVMAAIILALLWRDKVSEGTTPEPEPTPDPEPTPEPTKLNPTVHVQHAGDEEVGESFYVRGNFEIKDGSFEDLEVSVNDRNAGWVLTDNISASELGRGDKDFDFRTKREFEVGEKNTYSAKVRDSNGNTGSEKGSFKGEKPSKGSKPRVRVNHEEINDETGDVELLVQAESGGPESSIEATGFQKMVHQRSGRGFEVQNPAQSDYVRSGEEYVFRDSFPDIAKTADIEGRPEVFHYTAWTIDSNGRTGTYTDSFQIEPTGGDRGREGGVGTTPGAPGGHGSTPVIYNNQFLESQAGDLPNELIEVLEGLGESIQDNTDDQRVVVELGEELEGLVEAIEELDNLSGNDVEDIVDELEGIRRGIESMGETDVSGIEQRLDRLIIAVREQGGAGDPGGGPGSGDGDGDDLNDGDKKGGMPDDTTAKGVDLTENLDQELHEDLEGLHSALEALHEMGDELEKEIDLNEALEQDVEEILNALNNIAHVDADINSAFKQYQNGDIDEYDLANRYDQDLKRLAPKAELVHTDLQEIRQLTQKDMNIEQREDELVQRLDNVVEQAGAVEENMEATLEQLKQLKGGIES